MDDTPQGATTRPWTPLVARSASMSFDPVVESPRAVRSFVALTVRGWGLGDLAESAELLVSEIVTNVVRHARTPGVATVIALPTGVRVEVEDAALSLPDPRTPEPTTADGRGLNIVASLARRWGFDRGEGDRKVVWFELDDDVDATWAER